MPIAKAADMIGVDRSTLTRWCYQNAGLGFRVGSRWRLRTSTVSRLLDGWPPEEAATEREKVEEDATRQQHA